MQFLPDGEEPVATNPISGTPLSEEEVGAMLADLHRTPLGLPRDSQFRISVAGAQEKTALLWH
ncbi:hypothetical protein GCM10011317_50190 [Niveispirillum cyanobacteriorum]|nr:hypothetical protein GCM10011317_50190 [Niveispirillum cyanobacteriorum]